APRVDLERNVGELSGLVDHRSGHAEAGGLDRRRRHSLGGDEFRDDRQQVVVLEGCERPHRLRPRPCGRGIEQAEQGFGATDVAGEQHPCGHRHGGRRFTIDIRNILLHLGVHYPQRISRSGGLCPHPRLTSRVVRHSRDNSLSSRENSAPSAAETHAPWWRVWAAPQPTTSTRRRRCSSSAPKASVRRRKRPTPPIRPKPTARQPAARRTSSNERKYSTLSRPARSGSSAKRNSAG